MISKQFFQLENQYVVILGRGKHVLHRECGETKEDQGRPASFDDGGSSALKINDALAVGRLAEPLSTRTLFHNIPEPGSNQES